MSGRLNGSSSTARDGDPRRSHSRSRTANPDPVVREQDILPGIDSRHVASDAPPRGRHRTNRSRGQMGHLVPGLPCRYFPGHLVAAQTDPLVDRGIRGRPGMGIVARDTRQSPLALLETAGLGQADRLESGQGRIVRVELLWWYPAGMPMAAAAELELALDRPAFQPHGHREVFRPSSAPSRLDMGSARSMTPFAGDAGNHQERIKLHNRMCRELGRMTAEALQGLSSTHLTTRGRCSRHLFAHRLTGRDFQRALAGVVGQPVLENLGRIEVENGHESRRMMTRPKCIIDHEPFDLPCFLRRNQSVVPCSPPSDP